VANGPNIFQTLLVIVIVLRRFPFVSRDLPLSLQETETLDDQDIRPLVIDTSTSDAAAAAESEQDRTSHVDHADPGRSSCELPSQSEDSCPAVALPAGSGGECADGERELVTVVQLSEHQLDGSLSSDSLSTAGSKDTTGSGATGELSPGQPGTSAGGSKSRRKSDRVRAATVVVPDTSHCQITRSTRDLRDQSELLNLTLTPQLALTLTEEINKRLRTRLCEIAHLQWRGCELFVSIHRHCRANTCYYPRTMISGICDFVSVCVSTLLKKNDLSYQLRTWCAHSPWQPQALLRKRGQKVKVTQLSSVLLAWVCGSI